MKVAVSLAAVCLLTLAYATSAQVSTTQRSQPAQHHEDHAGMMMSGDMQKDMQMMSKMMMQHLGKSDTEYDRRFIDMMIPHHEGAVMMATDAMKNAKQQDLREMAAKMVKDQQKEIEQLKQWRKQWYGNVSETSQPRRTESP